MQEHEEYTEFYERGGSVADAHLQERSLGNLLAHALLLFRESFEQRKSNASAERIVNELEPNKRTSIL